MESSLPPPTNGAFSNIDPLADDDEEDDTARSREPTGTPEVVNGASEQQEDDEEEEEEVDLGDESEDEDVEIIMDAAPRSLDFRPQVEHPRQERSAHLPPPNQEEVEASSFNINNTINSFTGAQPLLTTEYTPISRGGESAPQLSTSLSNSQQHPSTPYSQAPAGQPSDASAAPREDDGIDPSTLPPVKAPGSHPVIDTDAVGVMDGRSILDYDVAAMAEKPWRRPGSDISDWFNYGFDEISWEAYCYRRRDLGELANVLKANVINFSGMQEEQLTVLPPEVRQMVMTGTSAMMNGAANTGMMGPGVMMDMSGMMPMGMGMEMGMGGGMMQMQPDGGAAMQQGVANGTTEQGAQGAVGVGMMQDGAFSGQQQGDMMAMGMGNEFGMQAQMGQQMGQQMYQGMDGPQQPVPAPMAGGRGAAPAAYRGRAQGMVRGRGFAPRGRGGGFSQSGAPPAPVRPASPLPPGVPTGPRNQNKYKDRDGNAPAVDGLDYGGTNKDAMGRTSSGEPDERSRKRRSSPGLDDSRSSKRR
ncbi:hypothetical protein H0H92_012873 [Tricholoma furcatifolium]|nr:hypothetical protein H0H92_012873 [Tricholoma furcatifolium]